MTLVRRYMAFLFMDYTEGGQTVSVVDPVIRKALGHLRRACFHYTSFVPRLAGERPEDVEERNKTAWRAALEDMHEYAAMCERVRARA